MVREGGQGLCARLDLTPCLDLDFFFLSPGFTEQEGTFSCLEMVSIESFGRSDWLSGDQDHFLKHVSSFLQDVPPRVLDCDLEPSPGGKKRKQSISARRGAGALSPVYEFKLLSVARARTQLQRAWAGILFHITNHGDGGTGPGSTASRNVNSRSPSLSHLASRFCFLSCIGLIPTYRTWLPPQSRNTHPVAWILCAPIS